MIDMCLSQSQSAASLTSSQLALLSLNVAFSVASANESVADVRISTKERKTGGRHYNALLFESRV